MSTPLHEILCSRSGDGEMRGAERRGVGHRDRNSRSATVPAADRSALARVGAPQGLARMHRSGRGSDAHEQGRVRNWSIARQDTASPPPSARIDQWLWSVRLVKTRADAAGACRAGRVTINGKTAKPATSVACDDRVEARIGDRHRIVEVREVIVKRVGAARAVECYADFSPPPPERPPHAAFAERDRGAGRPTKRDRRRTDRLRGR